MKNWAYECPIEGDNTWFRWHHSTICWMLGCFAFLDSIHQSMSHVRKLLFASTPLLLEHEYSFTWRVCMTRYWGPVVDIIMPMAGMDAHKYLNFRVHTNIDIPQWLSKLSRLNFMIGFEVLRWVWSSINHSHALELVSHIYFSETS